jgi:hypothetical protein
MRHARPALLAALLALAACSRGADAEAKRRVLAPAPPPPARAAVDLDAPGPLLALDAGEAARRLGSFDWTGAVVATVTRQGDSAARVHLTERHQLRQLASGEFQVDAEVDDGHGPGADAGKHVVFAGGMTYARASYAPWRERPTDLGRDARRFRDESFAEAADLARLYGPALALTPAGDVQLLGRTARRFVVSLAPEAPAAAARPDGRTFGAGGPDADTRRHLAFLDGRVPVAASGEVLLDVETGVPLRTRLSGAFALRDDPRVRVQVDLSGEVKALGGQVGAVTPPRDPLPDSRKPPGVAAALEAAGLKAKERAGDGKAEPAEEPDAP